jgi:hypothetical protein
MIVFCVNQCELFARVNHDHHSPWFVAILFKIRFSTPMMAAVVVLRLSLANICLDVQIGICMLLHPSDILALRKVCRHQKFSLLKSVKCYYQDL